MCEYICECREIVCVGVSGCVWFRCELCICECINECREIVCVGVCVVQGVWFRVCGSGVSYVLHVQELHP